MWALRGLVSFVARAAARLRPDAVVVGFDCPDTSVRQASHPPYKAHRPPKPGDLVDQLDAAPGLLRDMGVAVAVHRGYEADDVLASAAALARGSGWRTVLMTSDRDAFALIDGTTSVLRVRNGGIDASPLIDVAELERGWGVPPSAYGDLAALRGDTSDNLPGVPGIGAKTAARLLAAYGSVAGTWAAVDAALAAAPDVPPEVTVTAVVQAAGPAPNVIDLRDLVGARAAAQLADLSVREGVERNRRLMTMRDDLALPPPAGMRLPLDPHRVRSALRDRGIALGPSLWALTGGSPPPEPVPDETVAVPAPSRRRIKSARLPGEGQLALF